MRISCLLALLMAIASPALGAASGPTGGTRRTRTFPDRCFSLLGEDPSGAAEAAAAWQRNGGGADAAQCAALAQLALGDPASGARRLDALAKDEHLPAERRALLADQAAQAWLLAAQPNRALASAGLAMAFQPANLDIRLDRARAEGEAHEGEAALGDLSAVLAQEPDRVEALVLRARMLREQNRLGEAARDADRACALAPDDPDALLERGVLRQRSGDSDGARADWNRVLAVAPDTRAADLAQQDLALLDAGPESE